MKLLSDQDVYAVTVRLLRELGHDVVTAAERGLSLYEEIELLHAFVVIEPDRHRIRKLPAD